MAQWKAKRQGKKPTGGRYWPYRKKRLSELGSDPALTRVGKKVIRKKRCRGGSAINKAVSLKTANLLADGKYKKSEIKSVKESKANRHFARMNVLTKGAVIETEHGLARVTNRPSREGFVNAIFLKGVSTRK